MLPRDGISNNNNYLNWYSIFISTKIPETQRQVHKTVHFSICLNTQVRRQIGTYTKCPRVKTRKGKYQAKQDKELALTNHNTVPSTQLHLRLKRTPGSSRVLSYPGAEGMAASDKYQTSLVIPILAKRMAGRLVVICLPLRGSKSGKHTYFPKHRSLQKSCPNCLRPYTQYKAVRCLVPGQRRSLKARLKGGLWNEEEVVV